MDVHPTNNVSIGIDPYPYSFKWRFKNFTDELWRRCRRSSFKVAQKAETSLLGWLHHAQFSLRLFTSAWLMQFNRQERLKIQSTTHFNPLICSNPSATPQQPLSTKQYMCFLLLAKSFLSPARKWAHGPVRDISGSWLTFQDFLNVRRLGEKEALGFMEDHGRSWKIMEDQFGCSKNFQNLQETIFLRHLTTLVP